MSSLREDNRRLSQTVSELRGDRRARDRKLRDLEHQLDELRTKTASSDGAVPALRVEVAAPPAGQAAPAQVVAAPDAPRVVGVTEDGTEIVYEGEAAAVRTAAITALPVDADPAPPRRAQPAQRPAAAAPPLADVPVVADRIEVTRRVPPMPISARAAVRSKTRDHELPSERGGDAASDYRAAVELVKGAKYDAALVALRAFIQRFPRHDYADNAQYWVGEVFYAQKDYAHALTEFRKVIEVYPRGNKVPDALLKVGYCHHAMGQAEKGRAVLEQVVNLYPRSEPAMLAAKRLESP